MPSDKEIAHSLERIRWVTSATLTIIYMKSIASVGREVKENGDLNPLFYLDKNIKDRSRAMLKRYKRLTYIFDNAIEIYEYLDGKYGAPGQKREKKKKPSPELIKKRNQWNKERKARHRLRMYMKVNDYFACLTYGKDRRPPDMDTAKKHFSKFLDYVRKEYKKRGQTIRWMRNIEAGTKGAWHIHLVINRIPDTDIILKEAWKEHGGVNFKLLYEMGEFADLAAYITKTPDTDPRLKEADYAPSRNMPLKEPDKKRFVQWRKEPREVEGFYLDKSSYHEGTNQITGYKYRYYTLIRIHRRI